MQQIWKGEYIYGKYYIHMNEFPKLTDEYLANTRHLVALFKKYK